MNEISIKDLYKISKFFSCIVLNTQDYFSLISSSSSYFVDFVPSKTAAYTKHFANILGLKCYCDIIPHNTFKISLNTNYFISINDGCWSPLIEFPSKEIIDDIGYKEYINKMIKLNAFK